jgi:epoxyqueuosine reductase
LHICCGVCGAGAADVLISEGHQVTGFFYNPNISPESEYLARLNTTRRTAAKLRFNLIEGAREHQAWLSLAQPLKEEPEGGTRCSICYRMRLEISYRTMLDIGSDAFTSTLTISPHKSARIINLIGEEIGGSRFLARDFKKKDGFKRAVDLAKRWELYRQDYCGCIYSMEQKRR